MAKVGILTFHKCINYGSFWQAKCLADGLQSLGADVVILDHYSRRINIAEWRCAFHPVLPTPVPDADRTMYKKKIRGFFNSFEELPLSAPFLLDDPSDIPDVETVVVGSDEVWNLLHPWYGQHPLFYGDGLFPRKLISYAASFGNYPVSMGLSPYWGDKLRHFDALSVRDENSRTLISNGTGIIPELVLDPCLAFPVADLSADKDEPYVAVYGHNFSAAFVSKVTRWANEKGLHMISIGYRNDWADQQWITADPVDFVRFISNANAVVTNFFHGAVFALRFERPFVCEASEYRNVKLRDLTATTQSERHLVQETTPYSTIENCLDQPLSTHITQVIAELRQTSRLFLERALSIVKVTRHETVA